MAGDSLSLLASANQFFSPQYSLQLILDMLRPYRLVPLLEAVCTYANYNTDGLMNQSVFSNKQIPLPEAQKLFRVYPFIPVEGDLVYDCYAMLSICPNWETVRSTKQYHIRFGL